MPEQVFPDELSYRHFVESLEERGFMRLSRPEVVSDFKRLGLEAPTPREGREEGFRFHGNGLMVIVWTTKTRFGFRQQDAGWVLIREGDDVRYYSRPHPRTKNFLYHMLMDARIARWRVLYRPLCNECDAFMRIAFGAYLKSRYWRCNQRYRHADHKPKFCGWDNLRRKFPAEALAYIKRRRKQRSKDRIKHWEEQLALGNTPGVAMLKRKPWKVTKPYNKVFHKAVGAV